MHTKVGHYLPEQERAQILSRQSVLTNVKPVRQVPLHKCHYLDISLLQIAPQRKPVIIPGSIIFPADIIIVCIIAEYTFNPVSWHISYNTFLRSKQKQSCVCKTTRIIFARSHQLATSKQIHITQQSPWMTATFSCFYLSALDERISVEVIYFQTCNTSAFKQVLAFPLKKLVEQLRLLGYIHI